MYCCLSQELRKEIIQNAKMEKLLRNYEKKDRNEIKLLLLGTGEAGKSTFIRQMQILYNDGFDIEFKKAQIKFIHQNIFTFMQSLIAAMEVLAIEYENDKNVAQIAATLLSRVGSADAKLLENPNLSAIKILWNDAGIHKCYMRRSEYQLNDSAYYYLTDIDRIAAPNYIPTDQDILRMRVATSGIVEHTFIEKNVQFRMIDVGGQRSERRKWIHCFDNVTAIIFLIAISEYDEILMESGGLNRLKESERVFNTIIQWFDETAIILFLNKIDLLYEKVMHSHFDDFFPEYEGPRQDYKAACKFIRNMFLRVKHKKKIYSHFTCATNTENIKIVFNAVRNVILEANISRYSLY